MYGCQGTFCKNLFLKAKKASRQGKLVPDDSKLWLVVARHDADVSLKAISKALGYKAEIRFGRADILGSSLGVVHGEVSPFALVNDQGADAKVQVLLDAGLEAASDATGGLFFHPLSNEASTRVTWAELLRWVGASGRARYWTVDLAAGKATLCGCGGGGGGGGGGGALAEKMGALKVTKPAGGGGGGGGAGAGAGGGNPIVTVQPATHEEAHANLLKAVAAHGTIAQATEQNADTELEVASWAKSLFVKDKKKKTLFMITAPGDRRVDLKQCTKLLGLKQLRMAGAKDLKAALGVERGCVTAMSVVNDSACKVTSVLDAALLADGAPPLRMCTGCEDATDHSQHVISQQDSASLVRFLEACGHTPVVLDFEANKKL